MTIATKLLWAAVLLLPGGLLMAPLLWLARRREARLADDAKGQPGAGASAHV